VAATAAAASTTDDLADVVIVGGGPVGVITALLCAKHGLSSVVIERAPNIYDLPRAIAMDDEIQRVLYDLGLGEALRAITTPMAGAEFVRPDGERIIGFDLPECAEYGLGLHPVVSYYQPELESMLRRKAIAAGAQIRLGHEVVEFGQDADVVWVDIRDPDGNVDRTNARWMIAADGASSGTRRSLGIALTDLGFDQEWLVVDALLTGIDPGLPRFAQQICDPDRPTTYVRGHGPYRRWEFQLQPGEGRDEMTRPERVWELLAPWISIEHAELLRSVVYRFHAVVAAHMRSDRVFLAGDAAHQMPPFLGQGLCSGVRDAANLVWKLDLVRRGMAMAGLLDTYDEERRPHAAGLVAHAADTGRLIDQLSGRVESGTGLDAAYGGGRGVPRLEHGFVVGDNALVGRPAPAALTGWMSSDAKLGSVLTLLLDDEAALTSLSPRWSAVGAQLVVAPRGSIPCDSVVVLRPDRYVAALATGQAEIQAMETALLSYFVPPTM
jgi:3-(3-hydroxy-phenyl)propionate hydroxylase